MGSVNDWAAKAAQRIVDEVSEDVQWRNRRLVTPSEARLAAIIATFAEPLVALLREARREHEHGLHGARCCPRCTCESWDGVAAAQDGGELDAECEPNSEDPCTCGTDTWNKRVEAVLAGPERAQGGANKGGPAS